MELILQEKNPRDVLFDYFSSIQQKERGGQDIQKGQNINFTGDSRVAHTWLAYDNKSLLAIPMISDKHLIGLFGLASEKEKREWRREDIRLLKLVGEIYVNVLKRRDAKIELKAAKEYAENIVNTIREPLVVIDGEMKVISASRSFYEIFKVNPDDIEEHIFYNLGNGQWNIPELKILLEQILPQKSYC